MIMKDISQPQYFAISGIESGAASAPTDDPELKIEVANARSFFGKYSAVTLIAAGKLPITKSAFPVIEAGESLPLTYQAKVSADAPNTEAVNAAVVVFTISLVD